MERGVSGGRIGSCWSWVAYGEFEDRIGDGHLHPGVVELGDRYLDQKTPAWANALCGARNALQHVFDGDGLVGRRENRLLSVHRNLHSGSVSPGLAPRAVIADLADIAAGLVQRKHFHCNVMQQPLPLLVPERRLLVQPESASPKQSASALDPSETTIANVPTILLPLIRPLPHPPLPTNPLQALHRRRRRVVLVETLIH